MPSKNTVKKYVSGGIYHVYNRGVEKRKIFLDEQDYKVFLYYLKVYLSEPCFDGSHPSSLTGATHQIPFNILRLGNDYDLYKRVKLLAYCLMPNHFHFMLKQIDERAMREFMKRLANAYVRYFNEKYERVSSLFQGRYKAVLIDKESYLLHLSRYIHCNPLELIKGSDPKKLIEYSYSSYPDYIGERKTSWVHPEEILQYFKTTGDKDIKAFASYQEFVENYIIDSKEILKEMTLE